MRPARTLVVVLVLGGAVAAWAAHALLGQVSRDAAALLVLPDTGTLATLARATPAEFGFALANDSDVVALSRRQLPDWVDNFKVLGAGKLGNQAGLILLGGGLLHADRRAVVGGFTLLEGNLLVGVSVDVIKQAIGRVRPNHSGPGRWFAGGDSFPSSHAAHAFLLATVLATTFEEPEWRVAVCSLAFVVGLQRLHEGVHYPSDVLAGGALGWWVGHRLATLHGLAVPSAPVSGTISRADLARGAGPESTVAR